MTPTEFKSWFAVFSEAVDGTPTPRQWARIKARVDELGRDDDAAAAQLKAANNIYGRPIFHQTTGN